MLPATDSSCRRVPPRYYSDRRKCLEIEEPVSAVFADEHRELDDERQEIRRCFPRSAVLGRRLERTLVQKHIDDVGQRRRVAGARKADDVDGRTVRNRVGRVEDDDAKPKQQVGRQQAGERRSRETVALAFLSSKLYTERHLEKSMNRMRNRSAATPKT